mmetsp:Transcript_20709/g.39399  ORF Transcript_20709/g.39399 Transcript_20709/m.39399 type:complete len:785 (+) Transcript_20709:97-2451(+)
MMMLQMAGIWLVSAVVALGSTAAHEDVATVQLNILHLGAVSFRLPQRLLHEEPPDLSNTLTDPVGAALRPFGLPPALEPGRREQGAEVMGIKENKATDFAALLSAVMSNSFVMLSCIGIFMMLRKRFRLVYENNVVEGFAPETDYEGYFSWVYGSLSATTEQVEECVGLDSAMLLQFTELCMRILKWIGLPMVLVMGTLNHLFGCQADNLFYCRAAVEDRLNFMTMATVTENSSLYWVYALVIWAVVLSVAKFIFQAQGQFLQRRERWLQQMRPPRSSTIMVENIPHEYQSDRRLSAFFEEIIGSQHVSSAWVAKRVPELMQAMEAKAKAQKALAAAKFVWKRGGQDPARRPKTLEGEDSIGAFEAEVNHYQEQIKKEQERAEVEFSTIGGVNGCNGFVTFNNPWTAQLALNLCYDSDGNFWVVSAPPPPESIRWNDLEQDAEHRLVWTILGYVLLGLLFLVYLPSIVWISRLASMVHFKTPFLQSTWSALAPTMGLQFMVAMLPTFLATIFRSCFTLVDGAFAQVHLQNWYFAFQTVFVVLITAIGPSLVDFATAFVQSPVDVIKIFAYTMPKATHFYLKYQVLVWTTHALELLRYAPFFKYLAYSAYYDAEDARKMAEPEDQDYYGMGSRHARLTTMMSIGIIYSTLSPWIAVFAFINFAICRLIYGYLIPFAETKKADLGGVFWVRTLDMLFVALLIYSGLMTGVLYTSCSYSGPYLIAFPSVIFASGAWCQFHIRFLWENLPASKLSELKTDKADLVPSEGEYVQPEWSMLSPSRSRSRL